MGLGLYPLDRDHLSVDVVQGRKEPMLGWVPEEHWTIPTVRFRKEQQAPAIFATFLSPYKGQPDARFEARTLLVTGDKYWEKHSLRRRRRSRLRLRRMERQRTSLWAPSSSEEFMRMRRG
jgi:hypothetical protein